MCGQAMGRLFLKSHIMRMKTFDILCIRGIHSNGTAFIPPFCVLCCTGALGKGKFLISCDSVAASREIPLGKLSQGLETPNKPL